MMDYEEGTDGSAVDQELLSALRPPVPSTLFTGRTRELNLLDEFFRKEPGGELLLLGSSGSGKTQLALRFAQVTTIHW